jgi:hypothetical protein
MLAVPEPQLILTEEQKRSPLWLMLADHWNKQLADYRLQNDGDKDEIQTANLRGRIAQIKATLLLARDIRKTD